MCITARAKNEEEEEEEEEDKHNTEPKNAKPDPTRSDQPTCPVAQISK
jgi:hypothetical protein